MTNSPSEASILWIDDNADLLIAFQEILERAGFRVFVARDNDEALSLIERHRSQINLVIQDGMRAPGKCLAGQDIATPDVSIEFNRRYIRQELPDIPNIFFVTRSDASFFHVAAQSPNTHILLKPAALSEVFTVIRFCVGERQQLYRDSMAERRIPLIRANFAEINRTLVSYLADHPEYLYELTPRRFEELIAKLLGAAGFDVTLTPQTRDGGKDIYAVYKSDLGHMLALVECKKYSKHQPVGVQVVRSLYGGKTAERANMGVVVTTSFFTQDAKDFQKQVGCELSLRDYDDLAEWLRRYERDPLRALSRFSRVGDKRR